MSDPDSAHSAFARPAGTALPASGRQTTVTSRCWRAGGNLGWLWAGLLCLLYANALVTDLGLHCDDYCHKVVATDPSPGNSWIAQQRRLQTYPIRILGVGSVLGLCARVPEHETAVRLGIAGIVGLNALLLGHLAFRLTGERLAGVVTGWLFLGPWWAFEALHWISAWFYVPATTATLLFLHSAYSTLCSSSRCWAWLLAACGMLITAIGFAEATLSAVGLLPLLAVCVRSRQRTFTVGTMFRRCSLLLAFSLGIVAGAYFLIYAHSFVMGARGGMSAHLPDLAGHALMYLRAAYWMTLSSHWGRPLMLESLMHGLRTMGSTRFGAGLLIAGIAAVSLTAAAWYGRSDDRAPRFTSALLVLAVGLIWFPAALLLPGTLVVEQGLEYRMLYYPLAGLALAAGAMAGLLSRLPGSVWWQRGAVVFVGAIILLNSTCNLGVRTAFAQRARWDEAQLSALLAAVPLADLPTETVLVPCATEESFDPSIPHLAAALPGIFERSWALTYGVKLATGRDVKARVPNRWAGMTFSPPQQSGSTPAVIRIQDEDLPVDRMLPFTYRDGRVILIRWLHIEQVNGGHQEVEFPVARELGARDVETIEVRGQGGAP